MNAHPAVLTPNGILEGRKKRNIPQAKLGETELVRIAVGTKHGSITKDHETFRCRAWLYYLKNQRKFAPNFLHEMPPILGYCISDGFAGGAVMVWDVSFTCDICGKKKGEANHWWMVMLGDVPCFDDGQPSQRFTLLPWNIAESRNPDMYHLCGQGCAMQAMERFMTHGSIESELAAHSRR